MYHTSCDLFFFLGRLFTIYKSIYPVAVSSLRHVFSVISHQSHQFDVPPRNHWRAFQVFKKTNKVHLLWVRHFLVWDTKKHWAPSLHGFPIHVQMRCFHCSFHNHWANKQQVQHASGTKGTFRHSLWSSNNKSTHCTYCMGFTLHKVIPWPLILLIGGPMGGGRWWLEQERVLALSSQGIVGRRAQERRWSITGGGGCYVALPGNRKAQEVGSCWLVGWGWCWWCWCVCGGGVFFSWSSSSPPANSRIRVHVMHKASSFASLFSSS